MNKDQRDAFISYMEKHDKFCKNQMGKLGPAGKIKIKDKWKDLANFMQTVGVQITDKKCKDVRYL